MLLTTFKLKDGKQGGLNLYRATRSYIEAFVSAIRNRSDIKFVEGNENKIYSEGECVILEAVSGSDFIRVADRLAYSLLNID